MQRTIFEDSHHDFRKSCRAFFERECVPHIDEWERAGRVSREAWAEAGKQGLLGWEAPEAYGGLGIVDFRYNAVLIEEFWATGSVGIGLGIQNEILLPYLLELTSAEQKARWLPGYIAGETIGAIAISEPDAGSDVRAVAMTARRDGDHFVINGTKTFISNGLLADLVLVVCRTSDMEGHRGLSLIVVEGGTEGFTRGRQLDKIGQHAQDTAELSFVDVRVPATNLIGTEGRGFYHLMANLPRERLGIALHAAGASERAFELTARYAAERDAFGQPIGTFQVNRHALAEMRTKIDVMRAYLDRCIVAVDADDLSAEEAAGAKWWATETQWEIVDRCLQMHGGYGYVNEYEIARIWRDSRVARIYGGTNEVMKELVGRSLGFGNPTA